MVKVTPLDAALNAVWAMEEQALESLLNIAAREHDVTFDALEGYRAKALANAEQATIRDGVAIISANGALFKRANLFTAMSGATSYEIMLRDLNASLDDSKVRAIALNIDSGGGEASGADELAQAIYDARGRKPIVAYINGTGASAAYWIASAADRVIVSPTAILGSIGVQAAYREQAAKAGEKTYRFVSSQSPNKNPDLGTEAAASQIQTTIDAMAEVFVATVARNRGVGIETVLSDFGGGGIFVGKAAVEAGLADGIGSFEAVLADLSKTRRTKERTGAKATMTDETTFSAAERDAAVTAATTAERERVASLTRLADAHNANAKLADAITAGTSVADFALALADDAKAAAVAADAAKAADAAAAATAAAAAANDADSRVTALKTDEEVAALAEASSGSEPEGATADSVAARIAAA